MMKYGRYCVNLALFSVALPLMTSSLNSTQKQSARNYGPPDAESVPAAEREGNSEDISSAKAGTGLVVPSLETILARMSRAAIRNEAHLSPYTVTREYELFEHKRDKIRSLVIANITVLSADSKSYRIQRTEGSIIGEGIVRRVLEGEANLAKESSKSDITQENYNFRFLREEAASGHHCYVLQMLPRRKDKNLLLGTIWVDATTYQIRRLEGEPEKNPSWWVRNVHIVLIYADVSGMWLPTSSEYTARVRLLGPSMMVAHDLRYSYPQFGGAGNGLIKKPLALQSTGAASAFESKEVH